MAQYLWFSFAMPTSGSWCVMHSAAPHVGFSSMAEHVGEDCRRDGEWSGSGREGPDCGQ